ncbi:MAG: rhomboid family intramembrane serine protease [Betaproteobacteria bacterium]|jgi:membrane associated rhomboid family serine protease|nr:rhomboid family intramembrane serine protease [Betaproteobacteria bacterium]
MKFDFPPVTGALIVSCVVIFLLQHYGGYNDSLIAHFALWPFGHEQAQMASGRIISVGFEPWQLITFAFLHGGWLHILFNMWALFLFGPPIERLFGASKYLLYYTVCTVLAALAQLLVVKFFTGGFYPTIGASGGIFGLLLAFGMLYPNVRLMLLFPPIPVPAWLFVIGYGALELVLGVTGTEAGVAHFAHLGGMFGGLLLIQYWRGRLPLKPQQRLLR